ncbi:hypothetical protein [Streptomyces sp. NPDC001270]|uniref:hypothetical protein n=1 Tax=Streptomyces sp. NPDC001270 TaxID=3364554 RepID=UPI003694B914
MAFPENALGLRGELRIGQVWRNITGDLYTRDAITHTRGRPYRSNAADPSTVSATIRNIDGRYTPRNPEGPFYGLFGRGTPFRISLPGGPSPYLAMTGAPDRVTTPDVAALDITGDIDLRWEGEADWYAAGAQILIGKWGASGNRSYHLRIQDGTLVIHTTQDGTSGKNATITLPAQLPRRAALRGTIDVDNGAGGWVAGLYWAESISGPWTQIGTNAVGTGTISIYASTAPLSIAPQQLDLVTPARRAVTGKSCRAEVRSGVGGTVVAAPDLTARPLGTGGTWTDAAGRVWTLATDAEITDRVIRFEGEVPEWPPKWTPSARDAWTPIQAAGILRRLSQGQKPLASTLRRRIPSYAPRAYWPMEEGANATQAYSPIAGVRPMGVSGLKFASDDTLGGSSPLPVWDEDALCHGAIPSFPVGGWHLECVMRLDTMPTSFNTLIEVNTTGTAKKYTVRLQTNNVEVRALDSEDNVLSLINTTAPDFLGRWNRFQLWARQVGSSVEMHVAWLGVGTNGFGSTVTFTGTEGRPTGINALGVPGNLRMGHIAVFSTVNTVAFNGADNGFAGETVGARMARLRDEERIPLTIAGDPAGTALVGPQRPAALLDLLRECAEADGGLFGETADRRELTYRTRSDLYNQAPKLTLDYAAGQVAAPFEPVEDDQVRNSWEVQRAGGSAGVASLDTGPLSTQDPPDGIGLVADSVTLNLYSDDQAEPMASWLLHLSTWDEARYPSVTILLHRCPELIPAVLALREGDKIRITNLPKQFTGSGTAELLVDSFTETLLPRAWTITFNGAPAGPWTVGVIDDPAAGRTDADGCTLNGALDATSDVVNVLTPVGGKPWIDSAGFPGEFPFDVTVGGEVMRVTGCVGTALSQTFVVTRAVNGVTKAHANGTDIRLAQPAAIAL